MAPLSQPLTDFIGLAIAGGVVMFTCLLVAGLLMHRLPFEHWSGDR